MHNAEVSRYEIPKVSWLERALDIAMVPIMALLGGFKRDAIQETHPWHVVETFDTDAVDTSIAAPFKGRDASTFKRHYLFLFHAPVFGGWKNYLVLAPMQPSQGYRIGWIIFDNGHLVSRGINKLRITDPNVRVLQGTPPHTGYFFAIDDDGTQIPLTVSGQGRLGDNAYPGSRLL